MIYFDENDCNKMPVRGNESFLDMWCGLITDEYGNQVDIGVEHWQEGCHVVSVLTNTTLEEH